MREIVAGVPGNLGRDYIPSSFALEDRELGRNRQSRV
jgi:hypothetical protein